MVILKRIPIEMFSLPTIVLFLLVGEIWSLPLKDQVEDKEQFIEAKNISFKNPETSNDGIDQSFYSDANIERTGESLANYNPETSLVRPEELGSYFEGDILLPKNGLKNGILSEYYRWPNGVVPYEIRGNFNADEIKMIMAAIGEFHRRTCIRFVPRTTERDYISIGNEYDGCNSFVGRIGNRQRINLETPGCLHDIGTPIHELMHAVGFHHEQNREERDNYVIIHYENIVPRFRSAFYKVSKSNNFGVPYDYGSVMHYSSYAFSANRRPTITAKKFGVQLGRYDGFSEYDVIKINRMYNCYKQTKESDASPATAPILDPAKSPVLTNNPFPSNEA